MIFSTRTLLLLALASVAPGCSKPGPAAQAVANSPALPTLELPTAKPKRATIWRWVTVPATAAPWQEVTLQAKVSGYLDKILVDRGDRVRAGDPIAAIAVPELRADLLKWRAEAELAEQDFQRIGAALARAADLVTKQAADAARAKRDIARAGLESTQARIGYASFAAPFDGVITERLVDAGAFLGEGAKIATVTDDSTLRIRFGIPESEASRVTKGLPVKLAADSLPGKKFDALVGRTAGALDSGTRTLPVEADLKNPGQLLRPGMFFMASTGLEKHEQALLIPVDALLTEKAKTSVFKVVDGKAQKVPVKIGINDGENVELLDGVAETDALAVFGRVLLSDGQPLKTKAP